jgi:hypothetical protein
MTVSGPINWHSMTVSGPINWHNCREILYQHRKLSQFLFKRICLVPNELIHDPQQVQIVSFSFLLARILEIKKIGTRHGRNASVWGLRNWPIMSISGDRNYADSFKQFLIWKLYAQKMCIGWFNNHNRIKTYSYPGRSSHKPCRKAFPRSRVG